MLENFLVYMTPFNQERMIRVYLPTNYYKSHKKFPVLYMHDGQNVFVDEDAIDGVSLRLKDYLDKSSFEIIVVGIDTNKTGNERVNEYSPWVNYEFSKQFLDDGNLLGGKGEDYLNFIVQDLKPLIDNKYRTVKEYTAMAGCSLGGLITTFAACRYPHIFTKVACVSPAYWFNQKEIEELLRKSDLALLQSFYLDCGNKENGEDEKKSQESINNTKSIHDILTRKVANTKFQIVKDAEHNYLTWQKRIPEILSFLDLTNVKS